jgi:hypothetical protein
VDRLCDILDLLRTEVGEGDWQGLSNIVVGNPGHADPSWFSDPLQAGRDVHAVAQDVGPSDENISDVYPYSEA